MFDLRVVQSLLLLFTTQCVLSFPLHGYCTSTNTLSPRCQRKLHPRAQVFPLLFSSRKNLEEEARELLARAKAIRETLPVSESPPRDAVRSDLYYGQSPWSLSVSADESCVEYRLYVDIGREEGTWMDPLWAASGKRIELTLDVRFTNQPLTDDAALKALTFDNLAGKRGEALELNSGTYARLKKGFDRMKCSGGGYRVDQGKNNVNTVRFLVHVAGISGDSYGDVSIPEGNLYFSIPVFGTKLSQLSSKDGPVTVRQMGWHTGWRREESRIVGTFRAVPLDQARKRDRY